MLGRSAEREGWSCAPVLEQVRSPSPTFNQVYKGKVTRNDLCNRRFDKVFALKGHDIPAQGIALGFEWKNLQP